MQVVFNADDFGLHPVISEGILRALDAGIVRSTSVLATTVSLDELNSFERLKIRGGSLGIHLSLTQGKPLTDFPDEFLNEDKKFKKEIMFSPMGIPRLAEDILEKEIQAQVEAIMPYGPTHIDSHHHIHSFHSVLQIVARFAQKYGLAVRALSESMRGYLISQGVRCCDVFIDGFFGKNNLTEMKLLALIEDVLLKGAKKVEVMCHPGFSNNLPRGLTSYADEREIELGILTSSELASELKRRGIEIISYDAV